MNLEFLKQVLAFPSYSREERKFAEFLAAHFLQRGLITWIDEHNNVFAIKGQSNVYPCLSAHIDTVHRPKDGNQVVERDGQLIALDKDGVQTGLGGDDKGGVFIVLELLDRVDVAKVALFAGEEVGGIGSSRCADFFFEDVGYLLNFDAHGYGFVSYTMGGMRMFDSDGEFIALALPVLDRHGLTTWQKHPYSDPAILRKRFDFSILNLSAGYWKWHSNQEYVVIDEIRRSIEMATELLQVLGNHYYDFTESGAPFDRELVPLTY